MATTSGMEPSRGARLDGPPLRSAKRLLTATRPMFFPASALPVLLGTAWGARLDGALDSWPFALALAATLSVHAGVNILNDVYDDLGGTDRINTGHIHPFTGGSRHIQDGVMTARQMFRWGVALLAFAAVLGLTLFAMKGPGVLLFGAAGVTLGVLYSAPPVRLSARGLGEAAVGVGFGVLPVTGAAWLQSGSLDWGGLLLSLPVALWVVNILLVNEIPDAAADGATGKRTLVVRLGVNGTRDLYVLLNVLAALCVAAAVAVGLVPLPAAAAAPLLLLAALGAARGMSRTADRRRALTRSIKVTLAIHAAGTLWLGAWIWIG
jgi:1,4-dihydroxy-2-naphthoate octaprenyltransferase